MSISSPQETGPGNDRAAAGSGAAAAPRGAAAAWPLTVRVRILVTVAVVLAAGGCYVVGGIGYGIALEYGMGLGGGFWQVALAGSLVVGGAWTVLVLLTARLTGIRLRALPLLTVAVGVCFAVAAGGSVLGQAEHDSRAETARTACHEGVAAEMAALATETQPAGSPYRSRPQGTPDGCAVDIAVPSVLPDDRAYVAEHLAGAGFVPAGDTWVRGGLTVWLRSESAEEHLLVLVGARS
jgi:hypothetical protein